jgi:hypothetical protein
MLLWSVANLKETSLIFFACAMLFYTYKFSATAKPGFLVVAIVSAALQYAIRTPYPEYLYLNLAVIAIFLAYLWFARFSQRTRAFIVAAAIPLLAACAILWFHGICGIFHATAYRIFASHKLAVAEGGLCYRLLPDYFYAAGVNAQIGLMQMLRMLVLGWAHIILEPLPWRLGSPHMLMVMPQTILVYCLLPFAVLGIIFSFKKNFPYSFLLIAYFFLITPALSISGGNIGTTFRLRDMVMPVFLIFSALGLVEAFGGRKLNHDDA